MNDKPETKIGYISPLKRICMTIGELPSSYLETMTYYEMLVWFVEFLKNQVIPVVNNNSEATKELQNLFIELQNYVNNYFDNLDVQKEINNKLDQMLEDGVLEQIIEQFLQLTSLICFDNVESMKESPNLTNGSYAKTLGFYEKNDFGEAIYKIRKVTNDDEVDDMFIIALNDEQNELVAELIIGDSINTKQVGLYEDDTHDDSDKLNALIAKANTLNIKIVGNKQASKITKTIDIPAYLYIEKLKLNFYNGSYVNNYCIYVNANSTHDNWEKAYPNFKGELKDCDFYNKTNTTTLNCLYNYSNGIFEDVLFNKFDTSFIVAGNYLDGWKINRLTANEAVGTNYAINLGFLGDVVTINQMNLSGKTNLLTIGAGHMGIIINNSIINGKINLLGSNVTFNNLHQEGWGDVSPMIYSDTTILKVYNSYMYHNRNANEHNVEITNYSIVTLENITVAYDLKNKVDNSTDDIDINVSSNSDVNLINCFKRPFTSDVNSHDFEIIKTNLGLTLNTNQYMHGGLTHIPNNLLTTQDYVSHSAFYGNTTDQTKWKKETATYYYRFQPMANFDRKICYNGYYDKPKYNFSLTNNGNGTIFSATRGFYRIYRGTTDDSYTEYVDVAHFSKNLYDDGNFINGYKWISREAGNMDNVNMFDKLIANGNNVICFMDNIPSYGTWKKGDIIYKNDGTKKWLCTTDGTPGTWQEL